MARIRTIKPEFFTSEDIVRLSPLSRLFYVSLWCEADREGRLSWRPGTLKMRYLPGDTCDIETLAKELICASLIVIYDVDGKTYAEIPSFKNHQVINNRESESIIPARVKVACTRVKAEGRKEGKEGKGREVASSTRFDDFWTTWPKSDRKQDKAKCQDKWEDLKLDNLADKVLADVETKKLTRKWQEDDGKFIEAPMVYLNNRRWEDGSGGINQSSGFIPGAI